VDRAGSEQFPNLPTALVGDLNPCFDRFNQILLKACETAPKDRYQSAAEMNADLAALRGSVNPESPRRRGAERETRRFTAC